mgnify:CR=1 FL=1
MEVFGGFRHDSKTFFFSGENTHKDFEERYDKNVLEYNFNILCALCS